MLISMSIVADAETTTDDTIIITPPEELTPRELLDQLKANNKKSNQYIDHLILDLENVEDGKVVSKYYSGENEAEIIEIISVQNRDFKDAYDRIVRFSAAISYFNKPNITLAIERNGYNADIYTFGEQKTNVALAIKRGIPDAFIYNPKSKDGDNSWLDKYNPNYQHPVNDNDSGSSSSSGGYITTSKSQTIEYSEEEIKEFKKSFEGLKNEFTNFITNTELIQFFKKIFNF